MSFLHGMTTLLFFQLLGEALVMAIGLGIPGPVLGMILLFGLLLVTGRLPEFLSFTASNVLAHLSLLFVPAGVGVMTHWQRLGGEWMPILLTLLLSTLIGMAVTAWVMQLAIKRLGKRT